jgi:hypothetical protein
MVTSASSSFRVAATGVKADNGQVIAIPEGNMFGHPDENDLADRNAGHLRQMAERS